MKLSREQVLAFRYKRQHLGQRLSKAQWLYAAALGIQTGIPGTPLLALAARVNDFTGVDLEHALRKKKSIVETHTVRGATYLVPSEDFRLFTAGIFPGLMSTGAATSQEKNLDFFLGSNARRNRGASISATEIVNAVIEAGEGALEAGPLTQDELHAQWRKRLPKKYLKECRGCQSWHVDPAVVGAACASGFCCFGPPENAPENAVGNAPGNVVEKGARAAAEALGGEADGIFVLAEQWLPAAAVKPVSPARVLELRAELLRRFLARFAPANAAMFADWAGIAKAQAEATWATIADELEAVDFGKNTGCLRDDRRRLEAPPAARGVHLLPPRDPYLEMRDRATLLPTAALQSRVWKILANPGVIVVDGEIVGTWRAPKKGRGLQFTAEPFLRLTGAVKDAVAERAQAMAHLRGDGSLKLVGL